MKKNNWQKQLDELVYSYNRSSDGIGMISKKMQDKLSSFVSLTIKQEKLQLLEVIKKIAVGKGTTDDRDYRDSLNNTIIYLNQKIEEIK